MKCETSIANRMRIPVLLAALVLVVVGAAFGQQKHAAAIRSGFAAANGIRIHYLESGDASSPRALVLIPGWRLPAYLWNEQLTKFAPTIRVIAIDPRSQGESTKTADGDTPENRARDLRDVLTTLKVSQCVLVGWSQGAQDVAAYLQQFGTGSVEGVAFVDSPVSAGPAEIEIHKEFSKAILSNIAMYASHPEEFSEGMAHSIFKKPHPDIDIPKLVKSTLLTPTAIGITMLTTDIFGADRRPVLAKLDKPTLVVASSESPLLDVQKAMAAAIPGSKFVTIEDAAHAVFVDQSEKFDDALNAFLQSLPHQ
jgi:non-heme chloroperoxidase